ncbi:MAG: hypothetical protein AAGF71_12330 [Pseudomonadota bacterium]
MTVPVAPDLNGQLLKAHEAEDKSALVALYKRAAEMTANKDAHCFFLTHAYVFALETGAPEAADLHSRLKALGREE